MQYSNSMELVYIERGNEPGLVRKYEKEAWEFLTRRQHDFGNVIRALNGYLSPSIKALLVPAGRKVVLVNPYDVHDPSSGIATVRDVLRQAGSPYTVSLEFCNDGPLIVPIPVRVPPLLSAAERQAIEIICGSHVRDALMHRINANFLPETVKVLICAAQKHEVLVDTEDPAAMVSRIQQIFADTGASYRISLAFCKPEAPNPFPLLHTDIKEAV